MERVVLNKHSVGFDARYYPCEKDHHATMIYMLGNSVFGFLVKMGVKWLHSLGVNVLVVAPKQGMEGFYDLPIDEFKKFILYLKKEGQTKIGICGGSVTAMIALVVASYYHDISLTVAISPCDFIMQGYYRDGLDKAKERPAAHKSTLLYRNEPLPYLPFAYKHPLYWQKIREESKATHNMIASKQMFYESERLFAMNDDVRVKVEKIKGKIILAGAKDDCLWDTCKYIDRMKPYLSKDAKIYEYEYGTHFLFPQRMLKGKLYAATDYVVCLFASGRKHRKECTLSRIDFDEKVTNDIKQWIKE